MSLDSKNDLNLTRTFIALDFSDEVIKEIARINGLISNNLFIGKFTELNNLHLNLKFLGEIDSNLLNSVKERLSEINFKKFECSLGEIGIFHKGEKKEPKIIWIKINGKEIWALQKEIDECLKSLFKQEERFMSHLTIARVKYVKDKKKFEEKIKNIFVKPIKFEINFFKIKSSELNSTGPTYSDIKTFNLN